MSKGPAFVYFLNAHLKWALLALAALVTWSLLSRLGENWNYSKSGWRFVGKKNREHMAQDYLATRVDPGVHISDVVDDLGEPDWTTQPDAGYEAERLVYVVGGHYMLFGSETVSIFFDVDQHGLVTASGFR